MDEISEDINRKASISVSRNTPLALVVGAAGFIGSHLSEELLKNHIQVIGVDDFSTSNKSNLNSLTTDDRFHFINTSAENINLDIPRLDYLFIVASTGWNLTNILETAKKLKPKIVFISSINLYENQIDNDLSWFKHSESKIAKFAKENDLNARIVRLSAVFGPRMHFREEDPLVELIKAKLLGNIQKEITSIEFSSRALNYQDAVNLIIKSVLKGSTASKIFDGVGNPVKIEEVKQILMDPLWHETRNFQPSDLPPWITPNLKKTEKELNWQPRSNLVKSLRQTLNYFKDIDFKIPETINKPTERSVEDQKLINNQNIKSDWDEKIHQWSKSMVGEPEKNKKTKPQAVRNFFIIIIGWFIIFYGIFYPIASFVYGAVTFKEQLSEASLNLQSNNFDQSLQNIARAKDGLQKIEDVTSILLNLKRFNVLNQTLSSINNLTLAGQDIIEGSQHAVVGAQKINDYLKQISGQTNQKSTDISSANLEFTLASNSFSKAQIELRGDQNLPDILNQQTNSLNQQVSFYNNLLINAQTFSLMLPQVFTGQKSYLVVLGQEGELRPGGGHILAISKIDINNGIIKKVTTLSSQELDQKQTVTTEAPSDLKTDLNINNFTISDSNWEPDFPTNAKQMSWFYNKDTGANVDGVIFWDFEAIKNLLSQTSPINLDSFGTISSDNILNHSINEPNQAKFATSLNNEMINKLLFVSNLNKMGVLNALSLSLKQKNLLVFTNDPKLLTLLISQNFAGSLQKPINGQDGDFLSVIEANISRNRVNLNIDRQYSLETTINQNQTDDLLRISYINNTSGTNFLADDYKYRIKIYLPLGTKLEQINWGESDLKSQTSSTVDYGLQVYSTVLELTPKQQRVLSLQYLLPKNINSTNPYSLNVFKQASVGSSQFIWMVKGQKQASFEANLTSDLSFQTPQNF